MKTILTILLAFTVSAGMAQSKTDTVLFDKYSTTVASSSKEPHKVIKLDTERCWFKELDIRLCRCLGAGDTIIEHWRHGYQVIETLNSVHWVSDTQFINDTELAFYLYSDRKTKVTNKIIYSFK
jgi:uncharacterized protein YhfF